MTQRHPERPLPHRGHRKRFSHVSSRRETTEDSWSGTTPPSPSLPSKVIPGPSTTRVTSLSLGVPLLPRFERRPQVDQKMSTLDLVTPGDSRLGHTIPPRVIPHRVGVDDPRVCWTDRCRGTLSVESSRTEDPHRRSIRYKQQTSVIHNPVNGTRHLLSMGIMGWGRS